MKGSPRSCLNPGTYPAHHHHWRLYESDALLQSPVFPGTKGLPDQRPSSKGATRHPKPP